MAATIFFTDDLSWIGNTRLFDDLVGRMMAIASSAELKLKHILKISLPINDIGINLIENTYTQHRLAELVVEAAADTRTNENCQPNPNETVIASLDDLISKGRMFLSDVYIDQSSAAPVADDKIDYRVVAKELWDQNKLLDAAELIVANIPPESKPKWAGRILELVLNKFGLHSAIFDEVVQKSLHKELWKDGQKMMRALQVFQRDLYLSRKGTRFTKEEKKIYWLINLADCAAKVIYNASKPSDPFDEDEAWFVVEELKRYVRLLPDDAAFATEAWAALIHTD
jgi:hypothetical protein